MLVANYTGVFEPFREAEFVLVLLSRAVPSSTLFLYLGGHFGQKRSYECTNVQKLVNRIGIYSVVNVCSDETTKCRCFFRGATLCATLPPLSPGRYFFSLFDMKGCPWPLQLAIVGSDASTAPVTDRLPVTVLQRTHQRRSSRVPSSTNRPKSERIQENCISFVGLVGHPLCSECSPLKRFSFVPVI